MQYKTFTELPVVRPATSKPNDFHDSLLQRTSQTSEESARLDGILAHYQKDLEKQIEEEKNFVTPVTDGNDVVQI